MPPTASELERALMCIVRASSVHPEGGRIVIDPWSPLDRESLPRAAVATLVQRGCLIGLGRMQFRITRDTLELQTDQHPTVAAPTPVPTNGEACSLAATPDELPGFERSTSQRDPRFLVLLDAENAWRTSRDAGVVFNPGLLRALANEIGTIAFAFAYGNFDAIPPNIRESLTVAGFPLVHCARLRDGNGGKDTVDGYAQDLLGRFVAHDAVDGVILVTDDRDFGPSMQRILDRGKRLVRLSFRQEAALDRLGEVRRVPLDKPPMTPPARAWNPDVAIEDLQALATATTDGVTVLRRLQLRAPFVARLLRAFVRRSRAQLHAWRLVNFRTLLEILEQTVLPEDAALVTRDELRALLSVLVDIGFIERQDGVRPDGSSTRGYRPNWDHPFCANAIMGMRPARARRAPLSD